MGIKDKIYQNMPVGIQNLMISMYGFGWKKRRFGGAFQAEYQNFKHRESYTTSQWDSYTAENLQKLLLHAFNTVPYYKEKWSALGFTNEKIKKITPATINQLPFLEKDDLRKYCKTELVSNIPETKGEFFASSGSTGTPTSILFSHAMHQRWSAGFEARIRNWAGLTRFNRRGMIGGRRVVKEGIANPPYYRYNFFEKQVYFSAYHISARTAENYLHAIKKYKLDYMTGYAASNYFLARFFDEMNLNVPQLKAVITSSEKLTDEMRELFAKVYRCKTYDSYSGVEACGLISECEQGGLHISPDIGIIEFLNENGEYAKPGEIAEMVCTGLLNYDQPLIRYRIGDMAIMDDRKCACGRDMPLVKDIVGRHEDVVIGKDGREMVRFHGIFIEMPKILQAQLIQEDIDNITLNIVGSSALNDTEKDLLMNRIFSQLGKVNIIINELTEIPKGPNGKFRAVISKVKRSQAK